MGRLLRCLWIWYLVSLVWLALVSLLGLLTLFRAMKNSNVVQYLEIRDVPVLDFAQTNYPMMLWITAGVAAAFLGLLTAACLQLYWLRGRRSPEDLPGRWWTAGGPIWLPCGTAVGLLMGLVGCWYRMEPDGLAVDSPGFLGWSSLALSTAAGWWITRAVVSTGRAGCWTRSPQSARRPWVVRLSIAFLLGFAALCIEAVQIHHKFWDKKLNGNYDYLQFFREEEVTEAQWVLHSSSCLFAAVAALAACAWYVLLRWAVYRTGRAAHPAMVNTPAGAPTVSALELTGSAAAPVVARDQPPRYGLIPVFVAGMWGFALGVPWLVKIWTDVKAVDGWILPALVLVVLPSSLAPLLAVNLMMLLQDFRRRRGPALPGRLSEPPRPSELALWVLFLFPIYPLVGRPPAQPQWNRSLRLLRSRWALYGLVLLAANLLLFLLYPVVWLLRRERWRYAFLMLLSGGMVYGLKVLVTRINEWFTFEDWRNMLRDAEFPFLKAWASLAAACLVYLCSRRVAPAIPLAARHLSLGCLAVWRAAFRRRRLCARWPVLLAAWQRAGVLAARRAARGPSRAARVLVTTAYALLIAAAVACLACASWPLWGWSHVSKNALARCAEFNNRHEFELTFLQWLFDCDRDGYSAVLHGGDPDDFDPTITSGGFYPPDENVSVPVDRFEVTDPRRAKALPNGRPWSLMLIFLEGVTPDSIGAYGQRGQAKLPPTPNMDSLAAKGTLFTNARAFYPSTWDAWLAATTGRFLRIPEMSSTELSGDRYSPHNNLYKVLRLAGIDRWCHSDTAPYAEVLVPRDLHTAPGSKPAWKSEFNSYVSEQEAKEGVWQGDKRTDRLVAFLDDVKPGERFFLVEEMNDTHFPWRETPLEMSRKLGFPEGLDAYSQDAKIGGSDYKYYLQSITRVDGQIGRLLKKLRERKLDDQTIVIIISDHGCQWWEHERMYYVSHVYDPSLRVPLIIHVPGQKPGKCDEPVMNFDILPTIMQLAGVSQLDPDPEWPLPGRSLAPAIEGQGKVSKEVHEGYRNRDVPLLTHYDMVGLIHNFHYKVIFNRYVGTYLLFDLEKDPKEMINLADSEPDLLDEMMDRLRNLFRKHRALTGRLKDLEKKE